MQASGRRGGAAIQARVNRLIARRIVQFFMDIGRQGHLPQLIQQAFKYALINKAHHAPARVRCIHNFRTQQPIAKGYRIALMQAAARLYQRFPGVHIQSAQQQHLGGHARAFLNAQQTRGNHARFIEHHHIARTQELRQLAENMILAPLVITVANHHATGIARLYRRLGNQLFRKMIIKIACFHAKAHFLLCCIS